MKDCKDCKHNKRSGSGKSFDKCRLFDEYAGFTRRSWGKCGEEAKHFELIKPPSIFKQVLIKLLKEDLVVKKEFNFNTDEERELYMWR
jgi:hypothetical protein